MKTVNFAAAVLFLTGFICAGQAGAHGDEEHNSSATVAAGKAANGPASKKITRTKSEILKEKATKAALQKYNCLLCHKYKGKGGKVGPALDEHLRHHPKDKLKKLLKEPKKPMPPFSGTDAELDEFINTVVPAPAAGTGDSAKPTTKQVSKTYVCPMGHYQTDKPGKCPKCGMDLVEKK